MGLAFTMLSHQLGCVYWIEWVPSPSNLADDGSRRGSAETAARSLGIPVTQTECNGEALGEILRATPVNLVEWILG